MSSQHRGTKCKKAFTIHEIPEDPGPSGGYVETHTEYGRQQGGLTATTSSINIPPSPTKPSTRKKERSPSPALSTEVESHQEDRTALNTEPEGPYDVLWVENDSDVEDEGDLESEEGRKRKRRKMGDVSTPLPKYAGSGAHVQPDKSIGSIYRERRRDGRRVAATRRPWDDRTSLREVLPHNPPLPMPRLHHSLPVVPGVLG
jgi:hypothetical protein